jgi:signal transduction histidine kinase
VVGPVTLSAGWGLHELGGTLHKMAHHIGTVIERLQQSQREVLRAEQLAAVGQLAAGMAHELRNPLMSMKILIQAAAEGADPAGLRGRDLTVLEEEITRLERLIQTFLDFARPPVLKKQLIAAQEIIEATLSLASPRAARQGVRIRWDRPRRPVLVEADLGQLRQVLLNLLFNALDVLPRGGAVRIEARKSGKSKRRQGEVAPAGCLSDAEGRWLLLRVADTGPGLPAELGQQIFEPFVSTKDTGIGLGLSICRRIVEAHGGDISAADRLEGGAVFTVRLPLPPRGEPPVPSQALPHRGQEPAAQERDAACRISG